MPFNTLSYFLFLPVIFLIHYFCADRFRWLVLLIASFSFYAVLQAPHLIAILLLVTTITYFTGIWIAQNESQENKRYLLWGGISANVLTLVILKYLPFITNNLNAVLSRILPGTAIPVSNTITAIGASYFIFQAISCLVDIYLEVEQPERHFGHFMLYMSFFPKLLQGPIERGGDLLPQLKQPYVFSYDNVRSGMLLFAWGLFKKVVIADRLALLVNPVFDNVHAYSGLPLLFATYLFALQIYFDFAGYTDMALGTARMFNISLTQNFNSPYLATSIADFWRRWHISFSRWILDYIFKPLQMNLRNWKNLGTAFAIGMTFIVSGIWHGANWTFVVWGMLHGLYMAASVYYKPLQKKIHKAFGIEKTAFLRVWQIFITFNMVCFAWIFFRANSLSDAYYIILKSLIGVPDIMSITKISDSFKLVSITKDNIIILAISMVGVCSVHISTKCANIFKMPIYIRWLVYNILVWFMLFYGVIDNGRFIYYKF